MTPDEYNAYLKYFLEVLHAAWEHNGNTKEIHRQIQLDSSKLDENFLVVLQQWTTETLQTLSWEQQPNLAVPVYNLAKAISEFPSGIKAWNLDIAIRSYRLIEPYFNRDTTREYWGELQNALGAAYAARVRGDEAANIESAIACYGKALQVFDKDHYPEAWGRVQNNLGNVYRRRILEDPANNIRQGIQHFHQALDIRSYDHSPQEWAATLYNLGIIHQDYADIAHRDFSRNRGLHEVVSDNIENAIRCYQAALLVYNPTEYPDEWAKVQNSLGTAYIERIEGQKADNIEQAILSYINALKIHTFNKFRSQWANLQNNLGNAYSHRIIGKHERNIQAAIKCFKNALIVRTHEDDPRQHLETLFNLGVTHKESGYFFDAYQIFEQALQVVEVLRQTIFSGDETRGKLAGQWNRIYRLLVEVCLILGQNQISYHAKAIELIEQSKSRNLSEFLSLRSFHSEPSPISFSQIQQLVNPKTALIELFLPGESILIAIVLHDHEQPIIFNRGREEFEQLSHLANRYAKEYEAENARLFLAECLKELAEIVGIDEIISAIPSECNRLLISLDTFLYLFPFHAIFISNTDYLIDRFAGGIGYIPSCQFFSLVRQCKQQDLLHFFAIQNPTQDLYHADLEVEVIQSFFQNPHRLVGREATKTALGTQQNLEYLQSAQWVHFACHGRFNMISPKESHLKLAEGEMLKLWEILNLNLTQCRIVILSACETGLVDITSMSNEYIGLPLGFLYSGVPTVVCSLWEVNSISTTFLMIKLYKLLNKLPNVGEGDVALALNKAQTWLRTMTGCKAERLFKRLDPAIERLFEGKPRLAKAFRTGTLKQLHNPDCQPCPFGNPYYWSAFITLGF